jgi:hypothetical protein
MIIPGAIKAVISLCIEALALSSHAYIFDFIFVAYAIRQLQSIICKTNQLIELVIGIEIVLYIRFQI